MRSLLARGLGKSFGDRPTDEALVLKSRASAAVDDASYAAFTPKLEGELKADVDAGVGITRPRGPPCTLLGTRGVGAP